MVSIYQIATPQKPHAEARFGASAAELLKQSKVFDEQLNGAATEFESLPPAGIGITTLPPESRPRIGADGEPVRARVERLPVEDAVRIETEPPRDAPKLDTMPPVDMIGIESMPPADGIESLPVETIGDTGNLPPPIRQRA